MKLEGEFFSMSLIQPFVKSHASVSRQGIFLVLAVFCISNTADKRRSMPPTTYNSQNVHGAPRIGIIAEKIIRAASKCREEGRELETVLRSDD